jgi:hypothetical protein
MLDFEWSHDVPRLVATRLTRLGGFLGAGKTTTVLHLARHWTAFERHVGISSRCRTVGETSAN